jgi:hypothetical protein
LAEASINPKFDGYRLIFDNGEDGALMDMQKYFGRRLVDRLEPPGKTVPKSWGYSRTVEDFYYHVDDATKQGQPFIYALDSMDVLTSLADEVKFTQRKKAYRKGEEEKGSWGTAKAKSNSENLRKVVSDLRKTGSILLIISQTRDKLDFGWEKKTRSGGRALSFYATVEMWSSIQNKIHKVVRGKKREIGTLCKLKVKRTRMTGKGYDLLIPIYNSVGIDDIGSCCDYLIEEGHWQGKENSIKAPEFNFEGKREKLVQKIEGEGLEKNLRALVSTVWTDIEAACAVKRKSRYD